MEERRTPTFNKGDCLKAIGYHLWGHRPNVKRPLLIAAVDGGNLKRLGDCWWEIDAQEDMTDPSQPTQIY